jgi:hypothetical protein
LQMKPGTWVGSMIAILLAVVVYLLELVDLKGMLSLMFFLVGLWTLIAAFTIVDPKDRFYYTGWGVVIAFLSLFNFIPVNYTVALLILAIIALIVINVYVGKAPKIFTAATRPTPSGGDTPAAER